MSTESPGSTESHVAQKPGAASNVAPFPAVRSDNEQTVKPPPSNGDMAQADPLKDLVNSLERWDTHFQDNIRDVERRVIGIGDKVHKHDELFPVVQQNFKSMQVSLTSHADRLGQHATRLETYENQLGTVEAGMTTLSKDISALRAQIGALKRGRRWALWLAILAVLGLAASTAVQFGLVEPATAFMRLISFG